MKATKFGIEQAMQVILMNKEDYGYLVGLTKQFTMKRVYYTHFARNVFLIQILGFAVHLFYLIMNVQR
jgi:hypothetical protein